MNKRLTLTLMVLAGCASPEGKGLRATGDGTGAQVMFDIAAKPLPNIPLPNDFASRFDATSPTKKRINASMEASTKWERFTRASLDQLDGWGTYQSVTVAFDKPLDIHNIIRRHQKLVGVNQASAANTAPVKNEDVLQLRQHLVTEAADLWQPQVLFDVPVGFGEILFLPALAFFQHGHRVSLLGQAQDGNTAPKTRSDDNVVVVESIQFAHWFSS